MSQLRAHFERRLSLALLLVYAYYGKTAVD